jgi:membrane glycosyltransferase
VFTSQTSTRAPARAAQSAAAPSTGQALWLFVVLTIGMALAIVLSFVLAVDGWTILAVAGVVLIALNALWISGGAATAILGMRAPKHTNDTPPAGWQSAQATAILVTICGENPTPLAAYLASFTDSLRRVGLGTHTRVFVISDTSDVDAVALEDAAFVGLVAQKEIVYRRRAQNIGKKPGNIAQWLDTHGAQYTYMVVKDADSRMSADSIRRLIWQIAQHPHTGLLQAAISLVPGRTRFGRFQRTSLRLLGRNFGRGFAAWSGKAGNYWGHNAIMRVEAFRAAAPLPHLSGQAPFGGAILSHDFVEAAWMRRAGWDVELAPAMRGSCEDAPQSIDAFFRRDRRWCQGNLQHLRLLAEPNLHPLSRLHLVTGIFSYLSAPMWLVLVVLLSAGSVAVNSYFCLALVVFVLLVPKLCALAYLLPAARTWRRRAVILRAWVSEFAVSVLVGPLISLRQAWAVCAVALGYDCGWKSPRAAGAHLPAGWPEAAVGLAVLALASSSGPVTALWLSPIFVPLIIAPALVAVLNGTPR